MKTKQKFDGYAIQYDEWFMKNENLFTSELKLFQKVLGDVTNKRLLSVGCGSGLFESYIDCTGLDGIEPSEDMGEIAKKRGVNVIKYSLIEDFDIPDNIYDIIYFNGSSRACSHKKSIENQSQSKNRKINNIKLVVTSKNLAKTLDTKKKALNLVATFVNFRIIKPRRFSVLFWRDNRNKSS